MSDVMVERDGDIAVVTLNRPARYNAWTSAMRDGLTTILVELDADESVRAVVMTGAGERAFCAGQDLAETQAFIDGGDVADWLTRLRRCYDAFRGLGKPLVGAINGVAAGSGFQAVMMMDMAVGHAGVRMGQTEVDAGIPSIFGTWMMASRIGRARAAELALNARLMDGEECLSLGLLHHLVAPAQVMAKAMGCAAALAAKPPLAMRISKRALRELDEEAYQAAFLRAAEGQSQAFVSGEPQRAMAAFFAERARRRGI